MSIPIGVTAVLNAACYSAACYAITKSCQHLCTRPVIAAGRIPTVFERFRERCAVLQENVAHLVGERNWEPFSGIVVDNAWISTFVVSLFLMFFPVLPTVEAVGNLFLIFLSTAHVVWLARVGISAHLPYIANSVSVWVAPMRHRGNV